jgi:uncharacterized phage protein gp47/JayE
MFRFDTRSQVVRRVMDRLERAGLNSRSSGSFVRTLAEVLAGEGIRIFEEANFFAQQSFLDTASGPFLDMIGSGLFGMNRQEAQSPEASIADQAVEVYVDSGFLFDYLPQAEGEIGTVILQGTRLYSAGGQIFEISSDVFVPPGATNVYVGVTGTVEGGSESVPPNSIRSSDLPDPIKVRNTNSITGGRERETDANYRFRISQAYTTLERANEAAVRAALLLIPGIAEVQLENRLHGPGTFEVLLIPEGNRVLPNQILQAEAEISRVTAYTHTAFIREPKYVQFHADIRVEVDSQIQDKELLHAQVKAAVNDYFENVPLGGLLVVNQVLRAALDVPDVRDAEVLLLCLDSLPLTGGQYRLKRRELLTPSITRVEPVRIIA